MSDERVTSERAKKIQEFSLEERRNRQYHILKLWDAGRLNGRACIEQILDLEKMIYLGPEFKGTQKQPPRFGPKK